MGKAKMQMAANRILFFKDKPSFMGFAGLQTADSYDTVCEQIVLKFAKPVIATKYFGNIGDKLIALAGYYYSLRQMDAVNQAGQLLRDIPLPRHYEIAGRYYQTLCKGRSGEIEEAVASYERIADEDPTSFKSKAMLSMGTLYWQSGDTKSAWPLYVEALRDAQNKDSYDLPTIIQAQRGIAILKSLEGNHQGALVDLERLFPLVRAVAPFHPQLYYDHLNSYAVELGEAGRIEEAQSASRVALSSSFASAYPEWRETGKELALWGRRPSRSFVSISHKPSYEGNVFRLPAPNNDRGGDLKNSPSNRIQHRARIIAFPLSKNASFGATSAATVSEKPSPKLSGRQMLLRIIELVSDSNMTADQIKRMLEAIESIAVKK